jgi:hypothetical protein
MKNAECKKVGVGFDKIKEAVVAVVIGLSEQATKCVAETTAMDFFNHLQSLEKLTTDDGALFTDRVSTAYEDIFVLEGKIVRISCNNGLNVYLSGTSQKGIEFMSRYLFEFIKLRDMKSAIKTTLLYMIKYPEWGDEDKEKVKRELMLFYLEKF